MAADQQPAARPHIPRAIAVTVGAIGVAITLAVMSGVKASVERRIVDRFSEVAAARAERLGYEFERYHDELLPLASQLDAAEMIDKAAFERMARAVRTFPSLRALMWFEPSALGASAPAAQSGAAPGALPLPAYVVRFSQGEPAAPELIVDASNAAVFTASYQSSRPRVTEPLHTANFPYEPAFYQIVVPVPLKRAAAADRAPLQGFLVAVYQAQPVVDMVMSHGPNALAVRVTDRAMPLGSNTLAVYERPADTPLLGKTQHIALLRVAGRDWELSLAPTDAFIAENRTDEPTLVLLLGFALTAAAAIAALVSARWRGDMLTLVARRTAELAAAEARQRAVVANMADALVVTDSRGLIESINGAAQRLFGWDAKELIGRSLTLLVPDAVRLYQPQAAVDAACEAGAAGGTDLRGLRRDGTEFPLGLALSEVPERDGMRRIALMRDLSRERRAERAMSAFIGGTSKATGAALLHAATCALAQALGVRHAFIAETGERPGWLRVVSFWSRSAHAAEHDYEVRREPCADVLGQQLRCHAARLAERYPQSRLVAQHGATSYIGHPLQAADGRALGIVALFDCTELHEPALASSLLSLAASRISAEIERLESDKALISSRERLELAVEGSQLALWDFNVTTRQLFLSDRWSAMLGEAQGATEISLEEFLRRVHPEDRPAVTQAYRAALRGTASFYSVTHRVQRADGSTLWIRSHGKVSQRDAAGRALRLVGTNVDVTWEKTAADEVARRERELRTISDNVPATIMRLDRELRFRYANRRYAMTVGVHADALLGKSIREVIGEEAFREIEPHLRRTLEGDTVTYDREVEIRGRRRWLEVTVIPDMNTEWDVQGMFCIGLDVTERKEIERRMVEARMNAEAAARAKSEFLATMSHEIRTPMNGVLGLAGLLLDTELTAEQQGYAETLHRSATSLLEILNDILDMSKIEAGKLALEPIEFELETTVEDVAALWAPKAAEKSLELAVQIDASCPRCVVGDPGRLRQVLGNLVGNAIKFTEQGYILLRVSAAGGGQEDPQVLFEVEDTGIGIGADDCRRLFEPFSQADASTTRRFGGTGLGLAICRRLVQMMEGRIGVESEPGKGSRFWFSARLPATGAQPRADAGDLAGRRVLVVDDHPVNRAALRKQLQALGMSVTCAAGADEAWQCLQAAGSGAFDAAVVDHQMPGIDGVAFGKRLQADPRWHSLPIVLLTPAGQKSDGVEARAAGFAAYLIKPARASALRDALRAALAGKQGGEMPHRPRGESAWKRFTGRVLVVEDNEVNRRVAIAVLSKLGLQVDAAADGEEAVTRSASGSYDLVLMDIHMPRMDGLEAARLIRAREAGSARRVPIVAMTANVAAEARADCLAAGMDDFLPKPFVRSQLAQAIERWLPSSDAMPMPAADSAAAAPNPDAGNGWAQDTLDRARLEALHEAIGDDVVDLVRVFLDSAAETLAAIRSACTRRDPEAAYRNAHTLKSSAANVGAMALSAAARRLEVAARDEGKLTRSAAACIREIEAELERVAPSLRAIARHAEEASHAAG